MDKAKLALLSAEVSAAERRLERLKGAWVEFNETDPENKVRLDFIAQAIGEAEDALRNAERALRMLRDPEYG
jgi:hypothetical protein